MKTFLYCRTYGTKKIVVHFSISL